MFLFELFLLLSHLTNQTVPRLGSRKVENGDKMALLMKQTRTGIAIQERIVGVVETGRQIRIVFAEKVRIIVVVSVIAFVLVLVLGTVGIVFVSILAVKGGFVAVIECTVTQTAGTDIQRAFVVVVVIARLGWQRSYCCCS